MANTKTLSKVKQETQDVFNKFIRLRDAELPCISCGRIKVLQAGHYFPVKGYDSLRYNEDNVNGECAGCNCFDKSHLIGYGINLEKKIGTERYKQLLAKGKASKQYGAPVHKFTRQELNEIKGEYQSKIQKL